MYEDMEMNLDIEMDESMEVDGDIFDDKEEKIMSDGIILQSSGEKKTARGKGGRRRKGDMNMESPEWVYSEGPYLHNGKTYFIIKNFLLTQNTKYEIKNIYNSTLIVFTHLIY